MGNQNNNCENEDLNYASICPDCGRELEQKNGKLYCATHNDFYVPLSTYPLSGGWTDDDWRELHDR